MNEGPGSGRLRAALLGMVVFLGAVVGYVLPVASFDGLHLEARERQLLERRNRSSFQMLARELRDDVPLNDDEARELEERLREWPDGAREARDDWAERLVRAQPAPLLRSARAISFEGMSLDASHLDDILNHSDFAKFVNEGVMTQLDFESNYLGEEGARLLAEFEGSKQLVHLDLSDNRLGDSGVRALVRHGNFESLRSLNPLANRIGPEGIGALVEADGFGQLAELVLSTNPIGDEGAKKLAESKLLRRLDELHLASYGPISSSAGDGPKIGDAGRRAFREAGRASCETVRGLDIDCRSENDRKSRVANNVEQKTLIGALGRKMKKGQSIQSALKKGAKKSMKQMFESDRKHEGRSTEANEGEGTSEGSSDEAAEETASDETESADTLETSWSWRSTWTVEGDSSARSKAIRRFDDASMDRIRACSATELEREDRSSGDIEMTFSVGAEGRARNVRFPVNDFSRGVSGCSLSDLLSSRFPKPDQPPASVRVQFVLESE